MGNARWICTWPARNCNGKRYLKGRIEDCPLAQRCLDPSYKVTLYEFPSHRVNGNIRELLDPLQPREHTRRRYSLIKVFDPELHRRRLDRKNELKRKYRRRAAARKLMEQAVRELEASVKSMSRVSITLPCGEDCANCPYDECRYTDADVDAIFAEERAKKLREYNRKALPRKKAWREENREHVNAMERARAARNPKVAENKRRWYEEHREEQRTKLNNRYRDDPAFRQKKIEAARRRYAEKKDEINRKLREQRAVKRALEGGQ